MIFNSLEFIFLYLPITLIVYHLIGFFPIRKQHAVLLKKFFLIIASLFFYGYANPMLVLLIGFSVLFNFIWGKLLTAGSHKRLILTLGLIVNVGLLGYFKYTDFFLVNMNAILSTDFSLLHLALPLGISFFTFQQLAYLIDSYRGIQESPSFLDYSLSILFFTKLAEGPITTTKQFLNTMQIDKSPAYADMNRGLFLLSMGLVKKVFIADFIARFANAGFAMDQLNFMEGWLTSLAYTLQLYYDFSGYCDMAVGIGLMFGIHLPFNFDSPYKAVSIPDFWKRWHITLTHFLTNYLYIPLGGSRKGTARTYINILIVFLVSGLWHGAGWTFILWGLLHGICNIIGRLWQKGRFHFPKYIAMGLTFLTVNFLWVFFRADSVEKAISVITSMFQFSTIPKLLSASFIEAVKLMAPTQNKVAMVVFVIAFIITFFTRNTKERLTRLKPSLLYMLEILLCITLSAFYIASQVSTSSLYFNF